MLASSGPETETAGTVQRLLLAGLLHDLHLRAGDATYLQGFLPGRPR